MQWKEVEGKVPDICQDCAWCHPSHPSLCGLKSCTAPCFIELELWWEPGEVLTNTPATLRHLLSTGEELHFLTEVPKGVNSGKDAYLVMAWLELAYSHLSFLLSTYLTKFLCPPDQWIKEEQRCGSQDVSETEDRIEHVPQVSLKRKNKAKMQGGKERRKTRDFTLLKPAAQSGVAWFISTACPVLTIALQDPVSQRVEMVARANIC